MRPSATGGWGDAKFKRYVSWNPVVGRKKTFVLFYNQSFHKNTLFCDDTDEVDSFAEFTCLSRYP